MEILNELRGIIHLILHGVIPLLTAWLFFRAKWKVAFAVMMLTMLVDLDHLLATPIYQPDRCSIGFHPFHTLMPCLVYLAMCLHHRTRLVGLGLTIHMALDSIDCLWMKWGSF